jgi:uncharacterized protein YceH (UPF0502 family)
MAPQLSDIETRVLGALVEKETTTPEYYPLSLNALVNACNQKSNRDPVMALEEDAVRQALRSLAKFEHRLNELYNFHRHEIAVLCVLLLRGPQTPGELRTRAERMYAFEDLEAVHAALRLLMRREPPLVKILPRQPGTKESRYMHLFSGDTIPAEHAEKELSAETQSAGKTTQDGDRVTQLEAEIMELRRELNTLREQFATFQKQFQ